MTYGEDFGHTFTDSCSQREDFTHSCGLMGGMQQVISLYCIGQCSISASTRLAEKEGEVQIPFHFDLITVLLCDLFKMSRSDLSFFHDFMSCLKGVIFRQQKHVGSQGQLF